MCNDKGFQLLTERENFFKKFFRTAEKGGKLSKAAWPFRRIDIPAGQ